MGGFLPSLPSSFNSGSLSSGASASNFRGALGLIFGGLKLGGRPGVISIGSCLGTSGSPGSIGSNSSHITSPKKVCQKINWCLQLHPSKGRVHCRSMLIKTKAAMCIRESKNSLSARTCLICLQKNITMIRGTTNSAI